MNKNCEKPTAHSQHILHGDALYMYNLKRKKYKTVCAELALAKVTFDRMVIIFFYRIFFFFLFAMQLSYCNSQRVYDQR